MTDINQVIIKKKRGGGDIRVYLIEDKKKRKRQCNWFFLRQIKPKGRTAQTQTTAA